MLRVYNRPLYIERSLAYARFSRNLLRLFELENFDKIDMKNLIIIGAGPAGVTAGIYAARYKLDTLILSQSIGGTANEAFKIENFPGFESISGLELMKKFKKNLDYLKVPILSGVEVEKVKKIQDGFEVFASNGKSYQTKAIILAMGTSARKLGLTNEEKFLGKGLTYCATCDAPLFKDKIVAVVGGANSAVTAAIQLSDVAKKVYLIYRERLTAMPYWTQKLKTIKNLIRVPKRNVVGLEGKEFLEKIVLDEPFKGQKELAVQGIFIEIGVIPSSVLAKSIGVELNEKGFITADQEQVTSVEGIFSAGDVSTGSGGLRQVITACSEGAIAATSAYKYIKKHE